MVHQLDRIPRVGTRYDTEVGEVDLDEPSQRIVETCAVYLDPYRVDGGLFRPFRPFGDPRLRYRITELRREDIGDLLGREAVSRQYCSPSSRSSFAIALTTPSMIASGRGGQPGT